MRPLPLEQRVSNVATVKTGRLPLPEFASQLWEPGSLQTQTLFALLLGKSVYRQGLSDYFAMQQRQEGLHKRQEQKQKNFPEKAPGG